MYLSVVVPVNNQEDRVIRGLEKIDDYLSKQHYSSEIIVVDDGSTDNTLDIIARFSENYPRIRILKNNINQGKGAAIRKGILNSDGEYVLFTDIELETPIEDVERLFYWFYQGYDIVIGSRHTFDPSVKVENQIERKVLSNIFNGIIKTIALHGFNDTQCNFKAFKKEAAKTLFSHQKLDSMSFDIEILYLAVRFGFLCKEVAVNWKHTPKNKSGLIEDSMKMFKDIIHIKELHKFTFITKENVKIEEDLVCKT